MTLLTYNIHHGAPANPDVINLENIATVTLPDGTSFDFGATHFDLTANRVAQATFLNELNQDLKKALFIGGDYNAVSSSPEMLELKKEFSFSCLGPCPLTIPVDKPTKAIDFMLSNKLASSRFSLISSTAMTGRAASDHLPLIAVYQYE